MNRAKRVYINQPSKSQKCHKYHGKYGIAVPCEIENMSYVHFTEGPVFSMLMDNNALDVVKISSAED
jgi:hypothetical protein